VTEGCMNCGGPLETAMYCAICAPLPGEPWFAWRDRLRRIRDELRTGARRP
jgi:hypothetical protein